MTVATELDSAVAGATVTGHLISIVAFFARIEVAVTTYFLLALR